MGSFRFFIKSEERPTIDTLEEVAMLRFRLASIDYLAELLKKKTFEYVFKSEDNRITYMQIVPDSPEILDKILKRDPIWPYSLCDVIPVVTTPSMVEELQDFLGEKILTKSDLASLELRDFEIQDRAVYYLAEKNGTNPRSFAYSTFNPLISKDEMIDVYRRTIVSQKLHNHPMERSDVNPIGMPVGLQLMESDSLEEITKYVSSAPIYPDTNVTFHKLNTLAIAKDLTIKRLNDLGRSY